MTVKAFARELFGARYEQIAKSVAMAAILFASLRMSGLHVEISPFVLDLMAGAFTAGVMGQALASDPEKRLVHMVMLPIREGRLTAAYLCMLGAHTMITKTAPLLAAVFAVAHAGRPEMAGSLLCAANAAAMAACIHAMRRKALGGLWSAAALLVLWKGQGMAALGAVLAGHGAAAAFAALRISPYALARRPEKRIAARPFCRAALEAYFCRAALARPSDRINTIAVWCVAFALPLMLGRIEGVSVLAMGFAILSINTPAGMQLSRDRALERSVRMLPGQARRFAVPYVRWLLGMNLIANAIYLAGWASQTGGVTGRSALLAACFALQSALGTAALDWFFPIKAWKLESDLWHHPRKYIVPACMLLLAGAIEGMPCMAYIWMVGLAAQIVWLARR